MHIVLYIGTFIQEFLFYLQTRSFIITLNGFGEETKLGVPFKSLFEHSGSISNVKACNNPAKNMNNVSLAKVSPKIKINIQTMKNERDLKCNE